MEKSYVKKGAFEFKFATNLNKYVFILKVFVKKNVFKRKKVLGILLKKNYSIKCIDSELL